MSAPRSDALTFFGATGDLAAKKIFPALHAMARRGRWLQRQRRNQALGHESVGQKRQKVASINHNRQWFCY